MLANVCMDPDILKIMKYINLIITLAKIILPIIIIVKASFDLAKVVTKGDPAEFKNAFKKVGISILAGALIFFVPIIVNVIFDFVPNKTNFLSCFTDATDENIKAAYFRQAEKYLAKAEDSLLAYDYNTAKTYITRLEDGEEKENLLNRLNAVEKTRDDQINKRNQLKIEERKKNKTEEEEYKPGDPLTVEGSYYSNGKVIAKPGIPLQSEPDPSAAVNYWQIEKGVGKTYQFVYPTDPTTGLSLGGWPSNYKDIPTKLKIEKRYMDGKLIFPTTPDNNQYHFVYEHVSMDIGAIFGTPIYSPVSGTLNFSSWGGTCNLGSDETAYTVSITMDSPFTYKGKQVDTVFMTHMVGIIYRCTNAFQCKKHINQGDLIGFVGNATGTSESIGWMPHLHISFYKSGNYDGGLMTSELEEIYGIVTNKDYNVKYEKKAGQ